MIAVAGGKVSVGDIDGLHLLPFRFEQGQYVAT